jgi:hypothetical protein
MSYLGHLKNGVVLLDEPTELPDGTAVRVEPATEPAPAIPNTNVREFAGMLADLSESEWETYQRAARRRPLFEN